VESFSGDFEYARVYPDKKAARLSKKVSTLFLEKSCI